MEEVHPVNLENLRETESGQIVQNVLLDHLGPQTHVQIVDQSRPVPHPILNDADGLDAPKPADVLLPFNIVKLLFVRDQRLQKFAISFQNDIHQLLFGPKGVVGHVNRGVLQVFGEQVEVQNGHRLEIYGNRDFHDVIRPRQVPSDVSVFKGFVCPFAGVFFLQIQDHLAEIQGTWVDFALNSLLVFLLI